MDLKVEKILFKIAEFSSYDTEYDGITYTFCVYCGENAESESHSNNCLSLQARKILGEKWDEKEEQIRRSKLPEIKCLGISRNNCFCPDCGRGGLRNTDLIIHRGSKKCLSTQKKKARGNIYINAYRVI